jgi:hypothetical protein
MKNYIILTDSRQQKEKHILKEFDNQGILHIRTNLPSADYMVLRYNLQKGMYLDYSILIDSKKDLLEICSNLCKSSEHERLIREIELAKSLGCKKFVFLVGEKNIKSVEDIKNWSDKHTKVKGETLLKIMSTFSKHHDCNFIFVSKEKMGKKIIELLGGKNG